MEALLVVYALAADPCAFASGRPYERECRAQAQAQDVPMPRGKDDDHTRWLWDTSWLCQRIMLDAKHARLQVTRATLETPKGPITCEWTP